MYFNKKACAVLAALTLELSGAAWAASADSFSDVPKDHWSYEALDYLAQEGVIEGMGDNTFEGGRTMTRYEVASIVAKAMQKGGGSFGDKAVLEKLHGEYADEISILRQQVAANTKQIDQNTKDIDELKMVLPAKWNSAVLSASSTTMINTVVRCRITATCTRIIIASI